jgi:hypothetical protein
VAKERNFDQNEIMNCIVEPSDLGGLEGVVVLLLGESREVEVTKDHSGLVVWWGELLQVG